MLNSLESIFFVNSAPDSPRLFLREASATMAPVKSTGLSPVTVTELGFYLHS